MKSIGIEDLALQANIVTIHALPGIHAGSALLRKNHHLIVVPDNAWAIAWITLPDLTITRQIFAGDGCALSKQHKPDFEAAVNMADGSIYLFGSGSKTNRCYITHITADNATITTHDRSDLYAIIQQTLTLDERPNIEAAVIHNGNLRLFHRGADMRTSASIDLELSVLNGSLPHPLAHQYYALGTLENVALHITDAASIHHARTILLAAAEQTDNAIADGPVAGSVIGLIDHMNPDVTVRWTRLIDPDGQISCRKAEGIVVDEDGNGAWILTDPDSQERPAELCRVKLKGFA